LIEEGATRSRRYTLAPVSKLARRYELARLQEDTVWREDIANAMRDLPDNVRRIWQHGFTEMLNNAIDHSEGTSVRVSIDRTAATTEMRITDDGVGIFRKIQKALGLIDERHSVLELAKGKLTTDPARHSGEGIFFTSRMFDEFKILSGGVFFSHDFDDEDDWILEAPSKNGTTVAMKLHNHTARTTRKVFDKFSSHDEQYRFTRTIVPVRLAQYGSDQLVSRSQAKRLLGRVELFTDVLFDFSDVAEIGQAFADEIFRVFANAHPAITLETLHTSSAVKRMIERAKGGSS